MRNRLSLLSLPFLLSSLSPGCADDNPPAADLHFADLTAAERNQAIGLAIGGGALPFLEVFGAELAHGNDADCPAREISDDEIVFSADGCTAADGTRFDGRLVARNVPTFGDLFGDGAELDPAAPMAIELDGWSAAGIAIDGRFEQSIAEPADGQAYRGETDYRRTAGAASSSFRATVDCTADGPCILDGFASGGSGGFAIEGDFALTSEPSGWLILSGADELRLDFDAATSGCAPYTIDGEAAGEYCGGRPEPEPTIAFEFAGSSCDSVDGVDLLEVSALVSGEAEAVSVRMIDEANDLEEVHELAEVVGEAEPGQHLYRAILDDAITQYAVCGGQATVLVFTATAADGASACMTAGEGDLDAYCD